MSTSRYVEPENYLMEHLGALAADASSEAEAEAFLGALIPLAARLIPGLLGRSGPGVVRGVATLGRALRRHPQRRYLVRTLPRIVRRTAADIARTQAAGRPVTTASATRSLARQAAAVLDSPGARNAAVRQCRQRDEQWRAGSAAPVRSEAEPPAAACACSR